MLNHSNLNEVSGAREESWVLLLWRADREDAWPNVKALSDDVIGCLAVANHELNGPVPSETIGERNTKLLGELAVPVSGIVSPGLAYHAKWTREGRFGVEALNSLSDAVSRIAVAWDMVLAGDLDDLVKELESGWNASVAQYGQASDWASRLGEQIQALESQLLEPEIRGAPQRLDELLADDFLEFGSSGRVFNKNQILAALKNERDVKLSLKEFCARPLGSDALLATYRIVARLSDNSTRSSLRSSVWIRRSGRWQVLFHQGTLAGPGQ